MDIYTAYELLNQPQLPVETLVQIANDVPQYQVYVAAHPSATVELLQWLGQSADPNVVAAVSARLGTQAPGMAPEGTSTVPSTPVAASSTVGNGAAGAGAVKTSLGGGAIAGIVTAAVAVVAVIALVVGNQVTGGSVFGGGSLFGGEVSREQGCINLRDALLESMSDDGGMLEQGMEDVFSGDLDPEIIASGIGNVMGRWMSTISGKIGNREVREVWDEYIDLITNMNYEDLFSNNSLDELQEMMAKENEIMVRMEELCPGLQYDLPTY